MEGFMKKTMGLMMAVAAVLVMAGTSWAVVNGAASYTLAANVPSIAQFNFTANSIEGSTWTKQTTSALTFGTLTYDATYSIWRAPNYFALEVGSVGVSNPTITVNYVDGSRPSLQLVGLGEKANVTYFKMTKNGTADVQTAMSSHAAKKLNDVVNESITSADLGTGWLRMYVGLSDGSTGTPGAPFTPADKTGTYTGTLTISATGA
jgi:hypothetical protein